MWYVAIEGELSRKGIPFVLTHIDGKKHMQTFEPNLQKGIKFSTRKAAEEMMIHLPLTNGGKEVLYIETEKIPHNKK